MRRVRRFQNPSDPNGRVGCSDEAFGQVARTLLLWLPDALTHGMDGFLPPRGWHSCKSEDGADVIGRGRKRAEALERTVRNERASSLLGKGRMRLAQGRGSAWETVDREGLAEVQSTREGRRPSLPVVG